MPIHSHLPLPFLWQCSVKPPLNLPARRAMFSSSYLLVFLPFHLAQSLLPPSLIPSRPKLTSTETAISTTLAATLPTTTKHAQLRTKMCPGVPGTQSARASLLALTPSGYSSRVVGSRTRPGGSWYEEWLWLHETANRPSVGFLRSSISARKEERRRSPGVEGLPALLPPDVRA